MGYRATIHRDGSATLHDVPVFLEHELEDGRVIDRAWLSAALQRNRRRWLGWSADGHDGGYLAPLHVEHTVTQDGRHQPRERAGHMRLTRLVDRVYEGSRKATLLADLERIPEKIYARIKAGQLPYLSVEVHDFDTHEIDSCALMASTVPFFRLPLLGVSSERRETRPRSGSRGRGRTSSGDYLAHASGVICYRARGHAARYLYRLGGRRVNDDMQAQLIAAISAAVAEVMSRQMPAPQDGDDMPPDPGMTGAPAEESMPGVDDLPLGGEVGDDDVDAGDDGMDDDADDDDMETYCDDCPQRAARRGGNADGGTYSARHVAALQARIDAMEARDAHRRAAGEAVSKARRLGVYSQSVAKRIATYAAAGPRELEVYMATLEELADTMPQAEWAGEQAEPIDAGTRRAMRGDPVVATYAARGQRAASMAADLAREYDAFAAVGRAPRQTKGEYVADELRRKGVI